MTQGIYKRTEETKKKLSEIVKQRWKNGGYNRNGYWLGKHLSPEHKLNISSGGKGKNKKPKSKEQKNKQSNTMKKLYVEGKLIPHCKGKTKENYEPLRIGTEKASETRKKLIIEGKLNVTKNLGIYAKKGWKQTDEIKRIISKKNKGIIKNDEWKKKIIESKIKNKTTKHSEKTKEKIREKRILQIFPKFDTKIEIKIQNFLKQLGISFFTHQYIKEIKHGYQCDILIPSMSLVIECDGDYWHKYPVGTEIDYIRTKELIQKGFKILRLWENEIKVMELNDFKNKLNFGGIKSGI